MLLSSSFDMEKQVGGDSAWDRWDFGGQQDAADDAVKRGFQLFLAEGRCVSCHTIEQDFALFTDHLFHNIGVGINDIQPQVPELAQAFLVAKAEGADVDVTVLTNPNASHLGRFAVDEQLSSLGAFKTPTLLTETSSRLNGLTAEMRIGLAAPSCNADIGFE